MQSNIVYGTISTWHKQPNTITHFITPYFHFNLIAADPDDDKFVDCAVAGNAKFIVTEDSHYDVLRNIDFPKVDIIKLDDIIQKL